MATYLYHPEEGARVFETEAEVRKALKKGWYDTPAKFPILKPEPEVESPIKPKQMEDE